MARPTSYPDYGGRMLQIDPACTGLDVWHLQTKLIAWGSGNDNENIGNIMQPVIVNGNFDAATRDAVMRFQKAHRLPVTGIVDGTTRSWETPYMSNGSVLVIMVKAAHQGVGLGRVADRGEIVGGAQKGR